MSDPYFVYQYKPFVRCVCLALFVFLLSSVSLSSLDRARHFVYYVAHLALIVIGLQVNTVHLYKADQYR